MISPEIQRLLDYAEESHKAAKTLIDGGFIGFSAAQSYYTMFYLSEALLLSKGLVFSSHAAIIAAFGKEFAKTGNLDPKFHRYLIDAQERREIGHYGAERKVSDEQALESYHWAGEFRQVVQAYLNKV
ncbi:MAG: HEPN domain-containing protein [Chloroflexi bacterium]|nr:HEPN domain-containing protein [Chloroflexota bacterium]